jgi:hypothetical protein
MTAAPDVPTGTDALDAMLADPEIRESLAVIVANAPTLAALASISTALLQRGPEITDNVNQLINQLRDQAENPDEASSLRSAVRALAELAPLTSTLAERRETIQGFLDSPILQPEIVGVIGNLGEAALEADHRTRGRQVDAGGPISLVKQLRDPDVQETLSFFLAFARAFGRQQRNS